MQEHAARIRRQNDFFRHRKGNLLVFGEYSLGHQPPQCPLARMMEESVSEDFFRRHAYQLGVERVREIKTLARDQASIHDDSVPFPGFPYLSPEWGIGATAAMFTGQDVVFQQGTSYTAGPAIKHLADFQRLELRLDNPWVRYLVEFWRGAASEYESWMPVCTHRFRSPLDLANDLRGNDLFTDLYDQPELVQALLDWCTVAIGALDRHLRREIGLFATAPGGIRGVALADSGMIWLNGDPVDLISEAMVRQFNNPYIERLVDTCGAVYFHHHSIGLAKAGAVSEIRGLTVQDLVQDPNGPRLVDSIDDALIAASRKVPIDLVVQLSLDDSYVLYPSFHLHQRVRYLEPLLEKLADGRFVLRVWAATANECRRLVERVRAYQHDRQIT